MERIIDFSRDRDMLCAGCGHRFRVDLHWIDRWNSSQEACPGCGLTCEHEDAPRVTVDPADLALACDRVSELAWYHSSTYSDWPAESFDPTIGLTRVTRQWMGGDRCVADWAARQRAMALHVGTYEAAIHNMLRRMEDQADGLSRFYLYRVHLRPDAVVREGWVVDPSNWLGEVVLAEVCPPGVDVARYLNYHEDPGGISLALGRDAIASVQRVTLPLPGDRPDDWTRSAIEALEGASDEPVPTKGILGRWRSGPSRRASAGRELVAVLSARLPVNLRPQFESAAEIREGDDAEKWAERARGLLDLVERPQRVLAALDDAECRQVSSKAP